MKTLKYVPVFIILLWGSVANAQNVFDLPLQLPSEIKGQEWEHPNATVTGFGELKVRDSTAYPPIDVKYEGDISCDVSISALAHFKNKVEVEVKSDGTEIEAKSEYGTIHVYNCTIRDAYGYPVLIDESLMLVDEKVKVEIEGFYTVNTYSFGFSEYEAEGKVQSGRDPKVKLELENGTITIASPPAPPADGGGVPPLPPEVGGVPPFIGGPS